MRLKKTYTSSEYKVLAVDDEIGIIDSLSIILRRNGYDFTGTSDPLEAIKKTKQEHFDIIILDFIMDTLNGDKVVEEIRKFNKEVYIILLTGHKDIAPPLETIRKLEIQGYCEKGDKFDQLLLLIESAKKSISQFKVIKKYKEGLGTVLDLVPDVYKLQPIQEVLDKILNNVSRITNSENLFIFIQNYEDEIEKIIFKGKGEFYLSIEEFNNRFNNEFSESIQNVRENKSNAYIRDGVIIPLISEYSECIGVIFVDTKDLEYGIKFLEIYSKQIAVSIKNMELHNLLNKKNIELDKIYSELKKRYIDTIEALRMAVDTRDMYTRGHSDRVAYYAARMGEAFGLFPKDIEILKAGGIFHDIGKLGTSDDILFKTDKLNLEEYNEIKNHTLRGAHILSAVPMFNEIIPLVKYHHERVDGTGYPEGLKGDEIPFLAKIVSVADAFDAMTSNRNYRSKLQLQDAINQLIMCSGTQFDENIVEVFIKLLDNFEDMQEDIKETYKVIYINKFD